MAVSTASTTLNYKKLVGDVYAKLVDITSYPDLGSAPSKLDTTDLTATAMKTSILGLQDSPDLTFEANYDKTVLNTINTTLAGLTCYFQLQFGSSDGVFTWQGQIKAFAKGAGVDEVRKMTITISASTAVTFATS